MYALAHSVLVNPPGADPVLTHDQVWRGLVMKCENALPFVPGMTKCEVVERSHDLIVRDIVYSGQAHRERITLYPPVSCHFERIGDPGFIDNVISDLDGALLLTFSFAIAFDNTESESEAESAQGDAMRDSYIAAVGATLDRVRILARDGQL